MKFRFTTLIMIMAAVVLAAAGPAAAEINPGLVNPGAIIQLYGYSTADNGAIATFNQIKPDGTTAPFAIPAGKVFVIASVEGIYRNDAAIPYQLVFNLNIGTIPVVSSNVYFYSGSATLGYSSESYFPVVVTKPMTGRIYDAATMQPINSGYLAVKVKGYLYPYP